MPSVHLFYHQSEVFGLKYSPIYARSKRHKLSTATTNVIGILMQFVTSTSGLTSKDLLPMPVVLVI